MEFDGAEEPGGVVGLDHVDSPFHCLAIAGDRLEQAKGVAKDADVLLMALFDQFTGERFPRGIDGMGSKRGESADLFCAVERRHRANGGKNRFQLLEVVDGLVDDGSQFKVVTLDDVSQRGGSYLLGVQVEMGLWTKRGDGLHEGRNLRLREWLAKARAALCGLDGREGKKIHLTFDARGAVGSAVVEENELAILGGADVDFDVVGLQTRSEFDGR